MGLFDKVPNAPGYAGQVNSGFANNPWQTATPGGNNAYAAGYDANGKWNPGSALGGVQGAGGSTVSGWHGIAGGIDKGYTDAKGGIHHATSGGGGGGGGNPAGATDTGPMPTAPGFNSLLQGGPGSKTLLGGDLAMQKPGDVTADKVGYNNVGWDTAGRALVDRATQQGPSPWLKQSLGNQDFLKTQALSGNAAGAMGSAAAARSSLATHGGLSGGAGERLARGTAQSVNQGAQGIQSGDIAQRNLLGIQDEATKTGLLGQAAGLETGINLHNADQNLGAKEFNANAGLGAQEFNTNAGLQTGEYNIGNALQESAASRQHDLDQYKTQMGQYGANASANAILNAAPGKGKK